ncbi:phospho-sugar mutase [Peptostreptococcus canis]|uniref:Phosphoglucomutase n=1 Tax=Peptostreptococcus canis TaxID=1159213 RepID=A0ABR6TK08_9FIRM|nr:phospho-sugar mutase [Peptostreptococcus canis]MBC2575747.1 phospho-sugar mutase [Peptostreptococcus canis]MBP1998138.1 phosphoglucomutase [Peptostreptococcus canis]
MKYLDLYNEWLTSPYFDDETKKELESIKDDEKEIEDRFYKDLEFGTAGLRGILEAGTNRMNKYIVRKTSYGLANYFLKNHDDAAERGIVIAHDNRHMSREFCMEACETIAAAGMKVYYFDDLRTTPMLSFSVMELNCIGGIVITASHNPQNYNGYKVYGENGAQIMPDVATDVLNEINNVKKFTDIPLFKESDRKKMVLLDKSIDEKFIKEVKKNIIRKELIYDYGTDFKVIYTPLCGTGRVPVLKVLKDSGFKNVITVPEEEMPDPDFAGIKTPNPEESVALTRGIELLKSENADILIANDPDCDRVGVAVRNLNGEVILLTGNQIGGLLTEYVLSGLKNLGRLPENSCMIKTVVTSEFGSDIAKMLGVEVVSILTGFKFLGDKMTQYKKDGSKTFIIGYEESYGYLIGEQCRDKDAVTATLLIAEMALYYRSKGKTLYEGLIDLYDKYGYYREKTTSIYLEGKEGGEKIDRIMSYLRNNIHDDIDNLKIIERLDFQSGVEGFPKSNVLKYVLEDKSWIAFRPSGTEPKIKIYIGTYNLDDSIATSKLDKLDKYFLNIVESIK